MKKNRDIFENSEYFAKYKPIRNKLRQYDGDSIILGIIRYLRKPTHRPIDEAMKHPWLCLLLVKWTVIDEEYASDKGNPISEQRLLDILNQTLDLSKYLRELTEYDHYTLFMRNFAFQQFWYQRKPYVLSMARQSYLFGELPADNPIRRAYSKTFGLDIEDALNLSLVLFYYLCSERRASVSISNFGDLNQHYKSKVGAFLDLLARDSKSLPKYLNAGDKVGRTSWEYFEQTPLIRYPLYKMGNTYWCYSDKVMARALESHYYDIMKGIDADWFMTEFGAVFERYVEKGLAYSKVKYCDESEIRSVLGAKHKAVDFILNEGGNGILIDAKAVELSYSAKASHRTEIIQGATRNSVLKAVEQAFSVINDIETQQYNHSIVAPRNSYFLLIITYKELYLTGGEYFYEHIARSECDEISKKYEYSMKLPYENIFFLTIEEHEILTAMMRNGTSISALLERAVGNQKSPETRKYEFHQHFADFVSKNPLPEYLMDEINRMMDDVGGILKRNQSDDSRSKIVR